MGNEFDNATKIEDAQFPGYIVYWYWQPEADKQYVGITSKGSIKSRAKSKSHAYRECAHLYAALEKYGWASFVKDVLQYGLTKEEAEAWEKYYIAKWDLTNPLKGYNIQKGGLHSGGISEEGRIRLVERNTGELSPTAVPVVVFSSEGIKINECGCLKDAANNYGVVPNALTYGSKMGASSRNGYYFRRKCDVGDLEQLPPHELKAFNDRRPFVGVNASHISPVVLFDKYTGKRIAEFGCAKDASEFAGVNVTASMRGDTKTCGNYICFRAEEVVGVDVLSNLTDYEPLTNGKRITQYSLDGKVLGVFPSAREAERITGVKFSAISNCVCHKTHTAGGFVWRHDGDPFSKPKTAWESTVANGHSRGISVDQIDLKDGFVIATYPSFSDAARAVGSHKQSIRDVVMGKGASAAGFGWRKHME